MAEGTGIGLSRRFWTELVEPLLRERFPRLPLAAARIGLGSEVLGFDTALSADHDYGPCVQLFLPPDAFPHMAAAILAAFDAALPAQFEGFAVRYPTHVRPPRDGGRRGLLGSDHGVELYSLAAWCERFLGRQFPDPLTPRERLSYPDQFFLQVTAGAVFRDDIGELSALRQRLADVPRDVWLYRLAAQWNRIAEERAFVGRAGDAGDELGSRVLGARMVGKYMQLAFLLEQRLMPYPKWFGSAFRQLDCAPALTPLLDRALEAADWQTREDALLEGCRFLAALQQRLGVPGAIAPVEQRLHERPYRFIDTVAITNAIRAAIADPALRALDEFGAVDQIVSSNYVLAVPQFSASVMAGLLAPLDRPQ